MLKTVPNQRIIKPGGYRTDRNNAKGHFCTTVNEDKFYAMKNLSASGYKAWEYLETLNPNLDWSLSREHMTECCGFSNKTYYSAINELIDKGFLTLRPGTKGNTHYVFNEVPLTVVAERKQIPNFEF